MKLQNALLLIVAMLATSANAVSIDNSLVSTFERVRLASESHWGGSFTSETGFESGSAYFPHNLNDWGFWSGFAYSNMTDMTTADYTNEFSAYLANGQNNNSGNQFAVCYVDSYMAKPTISLTGAAYDTTVSGMWVTNTTYAYMSMLNGDSFGTTPFGGASGDEQDYFNLAITGITSEGNYTQTIDFKLANFTNSDNANDYILDSWTWVDLSSLGNVIGLEFDLNSTKNNAYGMLTPAYFAIDNFNGSPFQAPAVPEPATVLMLATGAAIACRKTR